MRRNWLVKSPKPIKINTEKCSNKFWKLNCVLSIITNWLGYNKNLILFHVLAHATEKSSTNHCLTVWVQSTVMFNYRCQKCWLSVHLNDQSARNWSILKFKFRWWYGSTTVLTKKFTFFDNWVAVFDENDQFQYRKTTIFDSHHNFVFNFKAI